MDLFPVDRAAARVEVNLGELLHTVTLPQVSTRPEEQDNRQSKVGLEKSLCIVHTTSGRCDGREELRNQRNADKCKTNPRASHTEDVLEWNFIESAAVCFPSGPEANVCLFEVSVILAADHEALTTQIEPQVNKAARPDKARSQLKTILPVDARTT